ncbi:hypothetical protein SME38J_13630 [Serratia marcescens]|nr:hypothetical protein SME38J_13630 [Serratia marcescens]
MLLIPVAEFIGGAIPAMAIKAEIIAVPLVLKTCKLFLAIPMLFLTG